MKGWNTRWNEFVIRLGGFRNQGVLNVVMDTHIDFWGRFENQKALSEVLDT